jgi:hypothetical protein
MKKKLLALAGVVLVVGFVCTVTAIDFPAKETTDPRLLSHDLLVIGLGRRPTYEYECFGGFLDSEYCYRLSLTRDEFERLRAHFGAAVRDDRTQYVYSLTPYWWPKQASGGLEIYRTAEFEYPERGPEGDHYLLLYDPSSKHCYIWARYNF